MFVSCQPGINSCLKSEATAIIWDWFTSWEVEVAIDDPDTASVNIFFSSWASVDTMPKVTAKGTPLSSHAVLIAEEVSFRIG